MVRIKEYILYKNTDCFGFNFDSDLNMFARTFGTEIIKTEQRGEFKDGDGHIYYRVLAYFEIPDELEPLEDFICDCYCESDEKGKYYTGLQKLGHFGKEAMKELYGDRISFSDNDNNGYTWIKFRVE